MMSNKEILRSEINSAILAYQPVVRTWWFNRLYLDFGNFSLVVEKSSNFHQFYYAETIVAMNIKAKLGSLVIGEAASDYISEKSREKKVNREEARHETNLVLLRKLLEASR